MTLKKLAVRVAKLEKRLDKLVIAWEDLDDLITGHIDIEKTKNDPTYTLEEVLARKKRKQ